MDLQSCNIDQTKTEHDEVDYPEDNSGSEEYGSRNIKKDSNIEKEQLVILSTVSTLYPYLFLAMSQ